MSQQTALIFRNEQYRSLRYHLGTNAPRTVVPRAPPRIHHPGPTPHQIPGALGPTPTRPAHRRTVRQEEAEEEEKMPGKELELPQLWKGTSCDGERKKSLSSCIRYSHSIHPPPPPHPVSRFLRLIPVGNSSYDSCLESNKLPTPQRHDYM